MTFHPKLNETNSNQTTGLVTQRHGKPAASGNAKAEGTDNDAKPANRELERAFLIRMPQRTQRTEAEKRKSLTSKMIKKALTPEQLAVLMETTVETLENHIFNQQVNLYPDYFTLPGSTVKIFPIEWIAEWLQHNTWIHGAVTRRQAVMI